MRYRKLSPTGDYTWGNNALDFYIDVPEAVAQAVKTRLLLWFGEWFLDIEEGTPYMQGVIGKHSQATADSTIQSRIAGTESLTGIPSFTSTIDSDTREYSASATIDTLYGPTQVTLENYINY